MSDYIWNIITSVTVTAQNKSSPCLLHVECYKIQFWWCWFYSTAHHLLMRDVLKVKTIYFLQFVAGRKTHCCESSRRNSSARVVHSITQSVLKVTGCISVGRMQTEGLTSRAVLCAVMKSDAVGLCTDWIQMHMNEISTHVWTANKAAFELRSERPPLRPAILTAAMLEYSSVTSLTKITNQYRPSRESLSNERSTNQDDVQYPCKIG